VTREVSAIESVPVELSLDPGQVDVLRSLGRELVAKAAWWGSENPEKERSVVDVVLLGGGQYSVRFRDVVGAIRLGDLHLQVVPKIPELHFRHIVFRSSIAPRMSQSSLTVDTGLDYRNLLAHWLIDETERLLRRGLRVGYSEEVDELSMVRGRIDVLATVISNQQGRPIALCNFEELSEDTPLNRVVKAACQLVASGPGYSALLRRRAIRVAGRMQTVGRLIAADRHARVCRLTLAYSRALPLARLVLEHGGVSTKVGSCEGRAFLLRTPELIEDGLRRIMASGLEEFEVRKQRLILEGSGVSMNPDLVFESGLAVGDVKYKYLKRDWDTSSLYQVVAFSAGFRASHCAILGFSAASRGELPRDVTVGGIAVKAFAWNVAVGAAPEESEARLLGEVRDWLLRAGSGAAEAKATGRPLAEALNPAES
jgi:5-methylcytosine-specific restriction enzyme subunit McrC